MLNQIPYNLLLLHNLVPPIPHTSLYLLVTIVPSLRDSIFCCFFVHVLDFT